MRLLPYKKRKSSFQKDVEPSLVMSEHSFKIRDSAICDMLELSHIYEIGRTGMHMCLETSRRQEVDRHSLTINNYRVIQQLESAGAVLALNEANMAAVSK